MPADISNILNTIKDRATRDALDLINQGGGLGGGGGLPVTDLGTYTPAAGVTGAERIYLLDSAEYTTVSAVALASVVDTPARNTSSGAPGQMAFDTTYRYQCVAANTWLRWALADGAQESVFGAFDPATALAGNIVLDWDALGASPVTFGASPLITAMNFQTGGAKSIQSGYASFGAVLNGSNSALSFDDTGAEATPGRIDPFGLTLSDGWTIALVWRAVSRGGSTGMGAIFNNSAANQFQVSGNPTGYFNQMRLSFAGSTDRIEFYNNDATSAATAGTAGKWHSLILEKAVGTPTDVASANALITITLDGVNVPAASRTTLFATGSAWTSYSVSRLGYTGGLMRMLVANRVLTSDERSGFADYLGGRYTLG